MVPSPVIGIDLGTTSLCVATLQNGHPILIPNQLGNKVTPAYIAFTEFERLIGEPAKIQSGWNPTSTIYETKRILGRKWSDPLVQQLIKYWPFEVNQAADGSEAIVIQCSYRSNRIQLRPEEVSAMLIGKMKEVAETYLKQPITRAVISAPAYFNDSQRQATCDAARIAGLEVNLISEPAAAALAYGRHKISAQQQQPRTVLVYDLGGGYLDVSVLTLQETKIQVLASSGDITLGGDDFDIELVAYFANDFKAKNGMDLTTSLVALRKMKAACEKAKRVLSANTDAFIIIDQLMHGLGFYSKLTRSQFEVICAHLFRAALRPVIKVLDLAGIHKEQIDDIICIGGSSRIPKIQLQLQEFFGKPICKGIDPDEAVAIGGATLAAILNGQIENLELVDVAPLTVGVEISGGLVEHVIDRCGRLPIQKTHIFKTEYDNQRELVVNVYEGNKKRETRACRLLGTFTIPHISLGPRGQVQIPVTFNVDVNGILTVYTDGTQLSINKGRLTDGEIEEMQVDAKNFAESDLVIRNAAVARNKLESYLIKVQKIIEAAQRGILSQVDEQTVSLKCIEVCRWLNEGTRNGIEYERKLKELKAELEPILNVVRRSTSSVDDV